MPENSQITFFIGKDVIDLVHEYTYLGTRISSNGNFNVSLEYLNGKALHVLFSLRKHTFKLKQIKTFSCLQNI